VVTQTSASRSTCAADQPVTPVNGVSLMKPTPS
jgi:hypothetical protein